jgi:sugar phosphate isomerase/epimerase
LILSGFVCLTACNIPPQTNRDSNLKKLPNAFYALCFGDKDAKLNTPGSQAELLKELGYQGMGYTKKPEGLPEILKALDDNGLTLFAVYLTVFIDPGEPKYDPRWKEVIKTLKGRPTVIWINIRSKKLKPSTLTGDLRAVEIVGEIADLAEKSGIKVALYPHYSFWMERVEDAVRVAEKVNRKNVGITFNLCHWLRVDKPETMKARLELAGPYLFSVTINGADTQGGWDRLIQTLDRGSFDVYKLLKALNEMEYTNPIGLQCYGIKGDARDNLKRSITAWRDMTTGLAAYKN